jgi:predicted AAA+ superfamily ATPase
MLAEHHDYLNFDNPEHRLILAQQSWDRRKELIILDEIHKMKNWKSWLKGIIDTESNPPALLVTGSARLDTIRKTGDSLAGRYFSYRLHPFDIRELTALSGDPDTILETLLVCGGFPEPYLEGTQTFYNKWKRTHTEIILRQDLVDMETVTDIKSVETLIEMLRHRVGSPVSSASLARDLQKDPKTIKRWLGILEDLFVIFPVRPWHRNISRALLKEPKYYFFDTAQVIGDPGLKLENLTACTLFKELHRLEDLGLCSRASLHFIRNKEGQEIDFAVVVDDTPVRLIEVKWSDTALSPYLSRFFPGEKISRTQLVHKPAREKTWPDGTELRDAARYLGGLDLG